MHAIYERGNQNLARVQRRHRYFRYLKNRDFLLINCFCYAFHLKHE